MPSRALVVLDKSSSMVTGFSGSLPKWDVAVQALDQVVTGFQSSIELGLMLFPHAGQCSPGELDVAPALGTRDAIMGALGSPPPTGGNWTPMAQTLQAAADLPVMALDSGRPHYVILITDGWQWCDPYDGATRFHPVDAVIRLRSLGITTYVVGFGDGVDALALNRMAVEGGTALAGCDPTGDAPDAAAPCYYRADAPAELLATLEAIATEVSTEVCDGQDNDCDGVTDEGCACAPGATRSCGTDAGICRTGTMTCDAEGQWGGCEGDVEPEVGEACDGLDNDCDGVVDEGCACTVGETRACGSAEGTCESGTMACREDGTWGACEDAVGPQPELCDGQDNDCDGAVDDEGEGALCEPGTACVGGACVADDTPPIDPPASPADAAGCGCRSAGDTSPPSGMLAALLALAALVLRVRRRG